MTLVFVCFMFGYFFALGGVGELFKGFLFSMATSLVFFFFTVTLKDYNEKIKSEKITKPLLKRIVSLYQNSIHNYVLLPNNSSTNDYSKISLTDLERFLDSEALNDAPSFRPYYHEFNIEPESYLDSLILSTTLPIEDQINKLKPYFYLLDMKIINVLSEIEGSMYQHSSGKWLKHKGRFTFNKDLFIESYKLIKKLEQMI